MFRNIYLKCREFAVILFLVFQYTWYTAGIGRVEQGELAPHVLLLTWLLPTYGDDVFMLQIYQPEYQEIMAAKPVLV